MNKLKYYKDIIHKLSIKWRNKEILRKIFRDENFNLEMRVSNLTKNDIYKDLKEISSWVEEIENNSKMNLGYGYEIKYRELHDIGKKVYKFPHYISIISNKDAILLLKKKKDVEKFKLNSKKLIANFPELSDYIYDKPFKILNIENIDNIIAVLLWFKNNKNRNFYIRELDIEGVDTKFIENNFPLLKELLPVILIDERIEYSEDFSQMFGFKRKPNLVRFRILDPEKYILNFSDISVPIEEFSQWKNSFSKIFIVENEINFLCFPKVENAVILFGSGYKAGLLQKASWLNERDVYYWGDIDTHGFSILSNVRKDIKNVKSFLMTEEILLKHKDMWVIEKEQSKNDGVYLTPEEASVLYKLKKNVYGKNVRLEQERIRYSFLKEYLKEII